MFIKLVLLTVILLQVSGCIATPRIFSKIDENYEPPHKEQPKEQVIEQPKTQINEQLREEIRRQVKEEIKQQDPFQ